MTVLLNIMWFVFGGFISFLSWSFIGILWSITIIGIHIGKQCFKFARLSAAPFGKDVEFGGRGGSFIINLLWMIFGGVALAIEEVVVGGALCLTIIGIPFGLQHFKLAKLALMPIGARIYRI